MRSPLCLIAVLAATLLAPASAHAASLGAGDGSPDAAPLAAQLGARTYRVVMDSTLPLESYAERIEAFRAYGMRPQITVDGVGTTRNISAPYASLAYAVAAFKRWPDAYSVSVLGEADGSGMAACSYARFFNRAYRTLKTAGVPRVLFGELTPFHPVAFTTRAATACRVQVKADGWSWHCYDWKRSWEGVDKSGRIAKALHALRGRIHTPRGFALPMHCTEYGLLTTERWGRQHYNPPSQTQAAASWGRALGIARKRLVQIVAWQVLPSHVDSEWDTSLIDSDGSPRQAFATIASAR